MHPSLSPLLPFVHGFYVQAGVRLTRIMHIMLCAAHLTTTTTTNKNHRNGALIMRLSLYFFGKVPKYINLDRPSRDQGSRPAVDAGNVECRRISTTRQALKEISLSTASGSIFSNGNHIGYVFFWVS